MNTRSSKLILIGFIIAAFCLGYALTDREPYHGSIPDPVQTDLVQPQNIKIAGEDGDVELSLLATYSIEGVVKSKRKYSDYPSQVSKYDFALAWGDLNKEETDDNISYSQNGRWYYWRYSENDPEMLNYIASHSANMHLIHMDQNVLKFIKKVDEDEHIKLEGYLTNVNFKDGPWTTSLSRNDTGNGACEIMYVTRITLLD